MIILDRALEERAAAGNPVRVALVGAGYMGRGIAAHVVALMGMELVAIANRTPERAERLWAELGISDVRRVSAPEQLDVAIADGVPAVAVHPSVLCRAEGVDVIIESTGEVEFGARVALAAIEGSKHVVLVNAELDATIGPILKVKADERGVVLTNTDGDEPGVTMNLLRYVRTIGMRPVLAGNIKGFIDPHRTPETQQAFATSVGQGPKMITSFADGTKLSMEATIVANAAGFGVAGRGMRGLRIGHVRDVLEHWSPQDLLEGDGFVDFVLEAEPGSGAFVVGHTDESIPRQYLKYFKMGEGPFYVFYTPWHLPHAEAPLTAARAALFHDASVTPLGAPRCEVVAIAKRDVREGDVLDGIGGFTCYGQIENAGTAQRDGLLPMGLSEDCTVRRPVRMDEPIRYDDIELPAGRIADALRSEQDERFAVAT